MPPFFYVPKYIESNKIDSCYEIRLTVLVHTTNVKTCFCTTTNVGRSFCSIFSYKNKYYVERRG